MADDIDIWRSAKLYVDRYGADAPIQAAMRADALLAQGDMAGRAAWLEIMKAIDALLAAKSPPDASIH